MAATTTLSFFHSPYPTLSSHSQFSLSSPSSLFKPYTVASRHNLRISTTAAAAALALSAFPNANSPTFLATASRNTQPMLPPFNVLITGSTKG